MGICDDRGLETSSTSEEALAKLEQALSLLSRYERDPIAVTDEALAIDPDFLFGYCFRAYLNMFSMDKVRIEKAHLDLREMECRRALANEREKAHMDALAVWLDGNWREACQIWDQILLYWPRDLFALKASYLADFYQGRSPRMRDRVAASRAAFLPDEPYYGYLLGMLAFSLEECGDYERAEEVGHRAVALNPDDVWAVHALAHVFEMRGRFADGIRWLHSTREHWAQENNFFAIHNWWHLALYYMELDRFDHVLAIYDGPVRGKNSELIMDLEDAASMLWRCGLSNIDIGNRFDEVASHWKGKINDVIYNFNDVHAMMALAGNGNFESAQALIDAMEARSFENTTNGMILRDVGLPICQALLAFKQERYIETVTRLLPVRYQHYRLGGSHAQRDVLDLTLIEASLRGEMFHQARNLLAARIALKPEAPGNWFQLAKALDGLDEREAANSARAHGKKLIAQDDPCLFENLKLTGA